MLNLKISMDTRDVRRAFSTLKKDAPKAIMRAVNRTAYSASVTAVKAVAKDLELPQTRVRKNTSVVRATPNQLVAQVISEGQRFPVAAFKARQTRRGVSYNLGYGRTIVSHSFFARVATAKQIARGMGMEDRHKGVFRRVIGSQQKSNPKREKIRELFGASAPHVFQTEQILDAVVTKARLDLKKNLDHEIAYLLSKRK